MLKPPFLLLMGAALLSGCAVEPEKNNATQEPVPVEESKTIPKTSDKTTPAQPQTQSAIEPDTMYLMLVGELALQRKQYALAYEAYFELSRRAKDSALGQKASGMAQQLKEHLPSSRDVITLKQASPEMATQKVKCLEALRRKNKTQSLKELNALLSSEPENFESALLELSALLQREGKESFVFEVLDTLASKTPSQRAVIYFVQSLLAMQMKNNALAEKKIAKSLVLKPDWEHPLIIQAQLAVMAGDLERAKQLLDSAIAKHPDNVALKKLLAQTLIKRGDYDAGARVYESLITQNAQDGESYIALSLINLQQGREENAKTILNTLAEQAAWASAAQFYLGKIEEKRGNAQAAIAHFDQVKEGGLSLEAGLSSVNLLINARRFDEVDTRLSELAKNFPAQKMRIVLMQVSLYNQQNQQTKAFDLLTQTLLEMPESKDLLYARALIAEHLGKLTVLEEDLKKILVNYPNDAEALNALGYTLLQDSQRYQEAKVYLQKAIKIKPNEAAIMDSFGWLQFKLGKLQQALNYLKAAYENQMSGEIAAHLCEVLWAMGRKLEAKALFDSALNAVPDDEYLHDFKRRFLTEVE